MVDPANVDLPVGADAAPDVVAEFVELAGVWDPFVLVQVLKRDRCQEAEGDLSYESGPDASFGWVAVVRANDVARPGHDVEDICGAIEGNDGELHRWLQVNGHDDRCEHMQPTDGGVQYGSEAEFG